MKRIEKVLVPLDHSDLAKDVLDMALRVADQFNAEVHVLRIFHEAASLKQGESDVDMRVVEAETAALRKEALALIGDATNLTKERIYAEVRSGPIVQVINEAAAEHYSDLIVMGTHGREGISELFTGSTTEQIVATSPASVLVVKPEGFPYLRD